MPCCLPLAEANVVGSLTDVLVRVGNPALTHHERRQTPDAGMHEAVPQRGCWEGSCSHQGHEWPWCVREAKYGRNGYSWEGGYRVWIHVRSRRVQGARKGSDDMKEGGNYTKKGCSRRVNMRFSVMGGLGAVCRLQ